MEKNASASESKIVFMDGDIERVLRGHILNEDSFFITIGRRDGIVRIAKTRIIKIDSRNGSEMSASDKHDRQSIQNNL